MKTLLQKYLVGLAAAVITFGSAGSQQQTTYNFRVLLDNKPIGFHQFDLSQNDSVQKVASEASFDVKLLFITAFKYRHSSYETWNNNCLTAIEATTNSNGKRQEVKGDRVESVLQIGRSLGEKNLDGCVQTFAYWNPNILDADRLLNSQTGEYVDVEVTRVGSDQLMLGSASVEAVKYKIESDPQYEGKPVDITLWYDAGETTWLALESQAKGDRTLRYELQQPQAERIEASRTRR